MRRSTSGGTPTENQIRRDCLLAYACALRWVKTGDATYNMALSRRRADAVMTYLVGQHDIPVYRIQMIGLGEDKPADEGKGREANAKNRRVELVKAGCKK